MSIRLIEEPVVNLDDFDFEILKTPRTVPTRSRGAWVSAWLLTRSIWKNGEEPPPIDAPPASLYATHVAW